MREHLWFLEIVLSMVCMCVHAQARVCMCLSVHVSVSAPEGINLHTVCGFLDGKTSTCCHSEI